MRLRTTIIVGLITILGIGAGVFFSGCTDVMRAEVVSPKDDVQKTEQQGSRKWQEMMATDINTLQTGTASKDGGKVYVVSFHPQGETRNIKEVDEVNITFSRPVAPLKKVEKEAASLIEITPHLKGEGYWKSSTTYTYRIDEKLKLSSRYNVKFKGYTSYDGGSVEARTWNFTTPTISIQRTSPRYKSNWNVLDQKVLIRFTQDVSPEAIRKYISINANGRLYPYTIRYSFEDERKVLYYWQKDSKDRRQYVTIIPTEKLPIASNVQVYFANGLPSMEGNIGQKGNIELTFRTYEEYKILKVPETFQPDRGIMVKLSNPSIIKDFKEKVSFEPAVGIDKSGNWESMDIDIHGKFTPGVTYTMTVSPDATDKFGNRLGEEKKYTVKCLDYSPIFSPPGYSHFVFEDYLEKKIPVDVRNVDKTLVYYKKMDIQDLKKVYKNRYFNLQNMPLAQCDTYTWQLPVKKNRQYVLGFDLEKIKQTEQGIYYINFNATPWEHYGGNLYQLTDVALVAKYSPGQIFIVPFDMKTGKLVPKLDFDIYDFDYGAGRETKLLTSDITSNADGVAVYEPGPKVLKETLLLDCFVFSKPRKSFIWGKKNPLMEMWNYSTDGYLDYNYSPDYYYSRMMGFTDKYLYKGGQTVKFKGMIRQIQGGPMMIPGVKKIDVEVFNSRNQSIKKMTIYGNSITEYGSFAGEFDLPKDAPTGYYRIRLDADIENRNTTDTISFSVQEYKPAKYEVKVSFDQKSLVAGQTLSGKINGRYLFGTPMRQAEGNTAWTMQHTFYTPPGWNKYSFGSSDSFYRRTIHTKDFKLDDEGNYKFRQEALNVPSKNSVRLTVHGEVKDKDNNRIAGSRSMTVHRGEFYIGLKSGEFFFKQNKPGKIHLVTVTPDGKLKPNTNVRLKIVRVEWKSFQKKDASGALRWEWKKLTHDVLENEINLPSGQVEKEYNFDTPGYYKAFVTGTDSLGNQVVTQGYFYVTGSGYVSWGVQEGRTIDLVTDKKKYKAGESVELLIKSPFETATALITVEREKVMWSKVVQLKGNANTVPVPVKKEFMPNAYINVLILKERTGLKFDENGNDIGKPEFYTGYKMIDVDVSEKKLKVEIKAHRDSYEPGDEVKLDIRVVDSNGKPVKSELCLSIVDKGVLNLVGYELPDPFVYFWKNRALDVKTVSTLNDVLGRREFKEKGENPGGDGGGAAYGSVVVRKNFKESAYYTAFLETDNKGKANVTFKLPDNLTTFKAMAAVGSKDNKFGRGSHDLLVKKNIILKPAVPNFTRPGDQFKAGVTVTNNSDKKQKVSVNVKAENVKLLEGEAAGQKINLAPGETGAVWFGFKTESTATAKMTFKAVGGRYSDGLYLEIPVRTARFAEAAASYGRVENTPVKERLIVPDGTLREKDTAEITLASSAMVGVKRNFDVLQEFPYDCLEQRISKQYPLLAAGDFLRTYGLVDMTKEDIDKRINKLLALMTKYQEPDKGFKYYPDSCCTSAYLTCYAMEFILDARARGYAVDKIMVRDGIYSLKDIAKWSINPRYPYSKNIRYLVQAYAVYVLSKDNVFTKDAINNLFEVRDRIPFTGLAYLVKALDRKNTLPSYMQPVLARTMLNKMKDAPTMTHFENSEDNSWWTVHGSSVKTTAVVLDAFLEVYNRFPYAEKIARWLTATTQQKRYLNTQENLRLFMAFEHYYRVFEKDTPDFVADVLFKGLPKTASPGIKENFSGRELTARVHNVSLKDNKPGDTVDIEFKKEGTGMLYYLLRMKYIPVGEVEAVNRGFEVTKTYTTLDGKEVTGNTFTAGEKYIATVTVKTDMERPFVMLDDPLPAGLRVLNPDFQTTSAYDLTETGASRDSKWKGYWGNFYRSEIYFDRVQVFADYLRTGTHTWKYLVIATNKGRYAVPNTSVMEMYNQEVFGRNANRSVEVR
jgi:alpha-2-macroglobulin